FLFVAFFASASASAQVRTFVAATGSDSNPCTRSAPCRTFQAAVNAAAPGGAVATLDSAGFGSNLKINQAIPIVVPPGVYAGLTVLSDFGIVINGGPSDAVILRGLTIINQGGAHSAGGIFFSGGGTLHIESCVVNGFLQQAPGSGNAGVSFAGPGNLEVKDSILRSNEVGILVQAETGTAVVTIDQ